MKIYNRATKKWEEKTTEKVGDLKKEKLCKGRRQHDFVLVLPPHIRLQSGTLYLNAEQVEQFYKSEDRRRYDEKVEDDFQKSLGIKVTRWRGEGEEVPRHYMCANCWKNL